MQVIKRLTAFTVDVTDPSLTVSFSHYRYSNVTEDTTPDVVLVLATTESDTTIAVDSASTTDCALSSSTLTGGGVNNTITLTHPSTTTFSDGLITCQVDLVDLAGNTADDTISFYVDQNAPVFLQVNRYRHCCRPYFGYRRRRNVIVNGGLFSRVLISGSSSISDTSAGSAAIVEISGLIEAHITRVL